MPPRQGVHDLLVRASEFIREPNTIPWVGFQERIVEYVNAGPRREFCPCCGSNPQVRDQLCSHRDESHHRALKNCSLPGERSQPGPGAQLGIQKRVSALVAWFRLNHLSVSLKAWCSSGPHPELQVREPLRHHLAGMVFPPKASYFRLSKL
jgi:hypothetical protein